MESQGADELLVRRILLNRLSQITTVLGLSLIFITFALPFLLYIFIKKFENGCLSFYSLFFLMVEDLPDTNNL